MAAGWGCLLLGGAWSQWGVPGPEGCLVPEVSGPGGVSGPRGGVPGPGECLLLGDWVVSQHALRQTPCEQND